MMRVNPVLSDKESERLCRALRLVHPRYGLLWLLGTRSGLRISDVLQLRVREAKRKVWRVKEKKTGKIRIIDYPADVREAIDRVIRLEGLKDKDYLVFSRTTRHDRPVSRQHANYVISRTASRIGLEGVGTHSMRKTYAINFVRSGGDLEALQGILNHKYLSTTLTYLLTANRDGSVRLSV